MNELDLNGLTLRQYFAAKALPTLIASNTGKCSDKAIAMAAYGIADAMIEEGKTQPFRNHTSKE